MNAVLLSFFAFVAASAGGSLAFGLRAHLHLVLGFAAGVMLGVVFFDLIPEVFALSASMGNNAAPAITAFVVALLGLHGLKWLAPPRRSGELKLARHAPLSMRIGSAAAVIAHSFADGIGIGLAFQSSAGVGITVAAAVLAHNFCDGLSTVSLMLSGRSASAPTLAVLGLDAAAPMAGALSTLAFQVPSEWVVLYLGLFAGVLLYLALAHVLPQAHARRGAAPASGVVWVTAIGAALVWLIVRTMQ